MITKIKPNIKAAFDLFNEGMETLLDIERNGIRVDEKAFRMAKHKALRIQKEAMLDLVETREYKQWKKWARKRGEEIDLNGKQLNTFLFDVLKIKPIAFTEKGNAKVDDDLLRDIGRPFTQHLLAVRKMDKILGTYLAQIQREQVDGILHPVFNLHLIDTYRSSADSPSFQNMPSRDPVMMALIKSVLFPSLGCHFGEGDFKGLEVGIGICYHQDPMMIKYWTDKTKDMHRDMAAACFKIDAGPEYWKTDFGKKARYVGKNGFVFPSFYGSVWFQIAPAIWKHIKRMNLKAPGEIPMFEYLKSKGITKLGSCDPRKKPAKGTFARHIMDVENEFWNERFRVYNKWRKEWFAKYLKRGSFNTLTGFHIEGVLRRNQVLNYPIQGDAFHCLLWTIIRLNNWLKEEQMSSRLMGQIHDSMIMDLEPSESFDVLNTANNLIKYNIRREWTWINVPLEAEFEVAAKDKSWSEKKPIIIEKDCWRWVA